MGFGSKACMIFSYLNCVCAFFIAWLFDLQITSFSLPTVKNRWDKSEKAQACRHAAILYLVLAIVMTVKSRREDRKAALEDSHAASWHDRFNDFEMEAADEAAAPLLPQGGGIGGRTVSRGLRREDSGDRTRVCPAGLAGAASRKNYGSTA